MRSVLIIALIVMVCLLGVIVWAWTPDKARETLQAKYQKSPEDMAVVLGTQLHVRVEGPEQAPAVVLLHGFGSSLHTWDGWVEGLSGRYRVVRFDLPGSGLSPPDASGLYTDARAHALISGLLDQLGIRTADLVGHSIGGRIGWSYAALYPERVNKLVLIAPDGFASPGFEYGVAPKASPVLGLMRYFLPRQVLKMNLEPSYGDPQRLTSETLTRYHDLMLAPGSRDALLKRMEQTVLVPPPPLLRTINAPVLLMWGQKDALIPVANAADYQAALPQSSLVTFPGLGHVPFEEDPQATLPPLMTFLESQ
jgi:pimeloyl-ACP methyl ester carboxylesterase